MHPSRPEENFRDGGGVARLVSTVPFAERVDPLRAAHRATASFRMRSKGHGQ